MTINYLRGDATCPTGENDQKLIIHICNNRGGWGRGFVLALSKKWPEPERAYREWFAIKNHPVYGQFELGNIQIINVASNLHVINMIAQEGYGANNANLHRTPGESDARPPIRYDALELCLNKVAEHAGLTGASIHGPRFGTGLSGGRWEIIETILEHTLVDLDITIYDL